MNDIKHHVKFFKSDPIEPEAEWERDLLDLLETPKSNFSDKNRFIVDNVREIVAQAKDKQRKETAEQVLEELLTKFTEVEDECEANNFDPHLTNYKGIVEGELEALKKEEGKE